MLKKCIKRIIISFMLICILPINSFALDTDEFFNFLIESAYPEAKEEEVEKEDTNKDEETSNSEEDISKEEDYIKVHVGEENIPQKEETQTTAGDLSYENNLTVTSNEPRILLYHTHGCETYSEVPDGNYHAKDKEHSVLSVGTELTNELNDLGWGVVHSTKYHDYPSYNGSYQSSLQTLQQILPQYESIDIAIDIHRDARTISSKEVEKKVHDDFTTTINGEKVAKFYFVVGGSYENASHNLKIAQEITDYAEKLYPGITFSEPLYRDYSKYNQYMAPNHMLIEVGSNGNSVEEAKATSKYLAEILDGYFKTK